MVKGLLDKNGLRLDKILEILKDCDKNEPYLPKIKQYLSKMQELMKDKPLSSKNMDIFKSQLKYLNYSLKNAMQAKTINSNYIACLKLLEPICDNEDVIYRRCEYYNVKLFELSADKQQNASWQKVFAQKAISSGYKNIKQREKDIYNSDQ